MKYLGHLVFGAIGAAFGLTGSLFAILMQLHQYHGLTMRPDGAIAFSVLGFIGAFLLPVKKPLGAFMMIAAGIGGIFTLYQLYALAGFLLIVTGIMVMFANAPETATAAARS